MWKQLILYSDNDDNTPQTSAQIYDPNLTLSSVTCLILIQQYLVHSSLNLNLTCVKGQETRGY